MVGNRLQALANEPGGPRLRPAGLAAGAEAAALAGKRQQFLIAAFGASDPGKTIHRIAAVQKTFYNYFNYRPKRSVLVLKLLLVDTEEGLPVVLQEHVEGAVGESPRMIGHSLMPGAGDVSGGQERRGPCGIAPGGTSEMKPAV